MGGKTHFVRVHTVPKVRTSPKWLLFLLLIPLVLLLRHRNTLDGNKKMPAINPNSSSPLGSQDLSDILMEDDFPVGVFEGYEAMEKGQRQFRVFEIQQETQQFQIEHKYIFQKHSIARLEHLQVLKHKKMTSCKVIDSLFLDLLSLLGLEDCFGGIHRVTSQGNNNLWKSSGNKITFYSQTSIVPYYFYLRLPEVDVLSLIHVFGLLIEEPSIAASKTLSSYHLGTYNLSEHTLEEGGFYLPCSKVECGMSYSLIMFVMDQVRILQAGILVSQ